VIPAVKSNTRDQLRFNLDLHQSEEFITNYPPRCTSSCFWLLLVKLQFPRKHVQAPTTWSQENDGPGLLVWSV